MARGVNSIHNYTDPLVLAVNGDRRPPATIKIRELETLECWAVCVSPVAYRRNWGGGWGAL